MSDTEQSSTDKAQVKIRKCENSYLVRVLGLPWITEPRFAHSKLYTIRNTHGDMVCQGIFKEQAQFILSAIGQRDEAIAALRKLIDDSECQCRGYEIKPETFCAYCQARELLAKLKANQ